MLSVAEVQVQGKEQEQGDANQILGHNGSAGALALVVTDNLVCA